MFRIACVGYVETMELSYLYDKAYVIAAHAHEGQHDKAGRDYILHPVRVAEKCNTVKAKIVALLHDTIEDTDVTVEYLRQQGFPEEIVESVLSVTRQEGETYDDYVLRAAANPIGREVKLADLEDNMDIRRLNEITVCDIARLRKYLRAWHRLQDDA